MIDLKGILVHLCTHTHTVTRTHKESHVLVCSKTSRHKPITYTHTPVQESQSKTRTFFFEEKNKTKCCVMLMTRIGMQNVSKRKSRFCKLSTRLDTVLSRFMLKELSVRLHFMPLRQTA